MTPSFALILDHDGIVLLQRADTLWLTVGEAKLDVPDLRRRLGRLRAQAEELSDGAPLRTLLVLPESQILYIDVAAKGAGPVAMARQVEQTLDGATPYKLGELVYDWSCPADRLHIAAVARVTLQEAESFAAEHRFEPVCFVASPTPQQFPGVPYFGLTNIAQRLLPGDEEVERPIPRIISSGQVSEAAAMPAPIAPAEPEQAAAPQAPSMPRPVAPEKETESDGKLGTPDQLNTRPEPARDEPKAEAVLSPGPETGEAEPEADAASKSAPNDAESPGKDLTGDTGQKTLPSFSSIRKVVAVETPPVERTESSARKPVGSAPVAGAAKNAPALRATAKRPQPPADLGAKTSAKAARNEPPVEQDSPETPTAPLEGPKKASGLDALSAFGALERKPAPRKLAGRAIAVGVAAVLAFAAFWTVISRVPDDDTEVASSMSTGVSEPIVEADTKAPTDSIAAGIDTPAAPPATAGTDSALVTGQDDMATADAPAEDLTASEPDIATLGVPEDIGDPADTLDSADDSFEPELAPEPEPETEVAEALPPAPLDPVSARAAYAVSGIWQRAPDQGFVPENDSVDDLYIASIDPNLPNQDAYALPETERLIDAKPAIPSTPQGPETGRNDISPGGVAILLGRPDVVPPRRPDDLAPVAAEPETATNEALRGFRPRGRPEGIVENSEKATLGGRTRAELAGLRPKERPASVQETAQALDAAVRMADAETADAQQATENGPNAEEVALAVDLASATRRAVAESPTPRLRPANIQQIADRARRTAEAAEAQALAEQAARQQREAELAAAAAAQEVERQRAAAAAASAASTVTLEEADNEPDEPAVSRNQRMSATAPSSASVARQATVKNALALNKVSLIGVYGTSSDRRALVRLPSGKYMKVKVGDRIDGGRVAAIGQSDLSYQKSGRTVTLTMPKG